MPTITFLPSNRSITVPAGTELLDAARRAGVEIDSPCGGKGTCGKCIVRILEGEVDSDSLGVLPAASVAAGNVLACRTRVMESALRILVPEIKGRQNGQITAEDETCLVRQELLPKEWDFDPLALKWLLTVDAPAPDDGLSDLDRLTRAIHLEWGQREVIYTLGVMRTAAETLRREKGVVTVTLVQRDNRLHCIRVEPGNQTTQLYGIAVDIGTTTVAVQLINLTMGRILATRSDYNDQVECGLDVISRINYARRPDRLEELRTRVLATVNRLISQVASSHGLDSRLISNAVFSGNTTMTHLLLGMPPEYIRLAPYTPTVHETPYLTAGEVGVDINPDSWIYCSPNVGSYVGGDITAGLLCTDLATDTDELSLFIDIGTNGELVMGNRDFLMACACSAGPAFEGGGISCGMRAALGAVERVDIDPATGMPRAHTIGNVKPKGICGSGMIDLLANLFLTGWLDPAGKLKRDQSCAAIIEHGKRAAYVLAPAGESATGEPLVISELDIENIIRAKAAIYSACALMLAEVGVGFDDLAAIYVAGGFGRFLNLDKAITIGLLPDLPHETFKFIGNASLMGSYMVVVSQDYRRRQQELARRITYMDLSTTPAYMDQYTGALFLPHTDPSLFPRVLARQKEGR